MIHPLSNINPSAKIGEGVDIAAFVTIGADVIIGDGCILHPGAVVMKGTRLGKDCKIYPGAVLGAEPQDLKFAGEYSTLEIGDRTTVREYCTLNRGTAAAGTTRIGSDCLLMAYVHVAHDCIVDDKVVLANNVNLAGHVEIGYHAVIGGMTGIVQFVKVGAHVMVAGGTIVRKDVPPFATVARDPGQYMGINRIGLMRRGYSRDQMLVMENAYKHLFGSGMSRADALEAIELDPTDPLITREIVDFVGNSARGIIRGPKQDATVED